MWSAAADPRVLVARVRTGNGLETGRRFDACAMNARILSSAQGEHVALTRGGETVRLDVVEGTVRCGPVALCFELTDDDALPAQLEAIRAFRSPAGPPRSKSKLVRGLVSLHAHDAREAGASLREIAELLLGPGEWPGDGEWRKSQARRLVVDGQRLCLRGPTAVLRAKP